MEEKYQQLKQVFEELLEASYKRAPKGFDWEGTKYWLEKAGLIELPEQTK